MQKKQKKTFLIIFICVSFTHTDKNEWKCFMDRQFIPVVLLAYIPPSYGDKVSCFFQLPCVPIVIIVIL